MSNKIIWDFLLTQIGNEYGVAALMGNLYAESGLRSDNVENRVHLSAKEGGLGITDAEYIASVDNGTYPESSYRKDGYGIGLAQWTHHSRKKNLYEFAKNAGTSIADETMQLNFLVKELKSDFRSVWNTLCNAKSVREASDAVLLDFERPANRSEKNCERRASFGQNYYEEYASGYSDNEEPQEKTPIAVKRDNCTLYVVTEGDCLSDIADAHGVDWHTLAEFNAVQAPYNIYIGQSLFIPHISVPALTHTVVKGDTLSAIAKKYGVSVDAIVNANLKQYPKITKDYIVVGWKLTIPKEGQ